MKKPIFFLLLLIFFIPTQFYAQKIELKNKEDFKDLIITLSYNIAAYYFIFYMNDGVPKDIYLKELQKFSDVIDKKVNSSEFQTQAGFYLTENDIATYQTCMFAKGVMPFINQFSSPKEVQEVGKAILDALEEGFRLMNNKKLVKNKFYKFARDYPFKPVFKVNDYLSKKLFGESYNKK